MKKSLFTSAASEKRVRRAGELRKTVRFEPTRKETQDSESSSKGEQPPLLSGHRPLVKLLLGPSEGKSGESLTGKTTQLCLEKCRTHSGSQFQVKPGGEPYGTGGETKIEHHRGGGNMRTSQRGKTSLPRRKKITDRKRGGLSSLRALCPRA